MVYRTLCRLFTALPVLLALSGVLLREGTAWSAETERRISVRSQTLEINSQGLLVAEGDVLLSGPGLFLRADHLTYDPASGSVSVSGNVRMEEENGAISTADSLDLDINSLTGGIRGGEVLTPETGMRISGEVISRTGPDEYEVQDAVFTSCPGDCPDWSFEASRLRVRREGYLTARGVSFRILGIPVFYTPYLFYPVKTRRQTGLLIPEISYTDDTGWEGAFPFFINFGPTADATLTPRTFSRDATGWEGELRYRLDMGGGGDWKGFAMGGGQEERWYYYGRSAWPLSQDAWFRIRWYDAGTAQAPRDFGRSFQERYPGAVSRHATLEWDRGALSLWAAAERPLSDATHSRVASTAGILRDQGGAAMGPLRIGPMDLAFSGQWTGFDDDGERFLVSPEASIRFNLPGKGGGRLFGRLVEARGGAGTDDGAFSVYGLAQTMSVQRPFSWGLHRLEVELTAARSTEASFTEGLPRDALDISIERSMISARARSRVWAGRLRWELSGGVWDDSEIRDNGAFARTEMRYRGLRLSAAYNGDGEFLLILPCAAFDSAQAKGWNATAGLSSARGDLSLSRSSGYNAPDLLMGEFRLPAGAFELSGSAQYDQEAQAMAQSSATLSVRGRCWTIGLASSLAQDRRDWRLSLSLAR